MTDSTLTPAPSDPPMAATPLLTEQGLAVCGKFSSDLADLCNAASMAGMTPNMLCGQLMTMTLLLGFQVKDDVDAVPTTPPAPLPVTPAPSPLLTTGSTATLTVGTLATPTTDTQVLALTVGPYSLELEHTVHDGFTYTANGLWPGVTLYGKAGDLMQMSVEATTVVATISQDHGVTWTPFFTYQRTETGTLTAQVTSTEYAGAAQLVVTP